MEKLGFRLIDCHAHVGRLPGTVGYIVTGDELDYALKNEGVLYALASSASVTTVGQEYGNAEAVREVAKHPDTIGGMIWINPHDPGWEEDAEATLKHGFLGIKLHPTLDHYKAGKDSLGGVFAFAAKHRLSILTHAQEGDAAPLNYIELVEQYPDVKVVFAHFGPGVQGIVMAKKYDNVYLDTTGVPAFTIWIAVAAAGSEKVLFGTDSPMGYKVGDGPERPEFRTFRKATDEIRSLGLRDMEFENIFYKNSVKVFNIRLGGGAEGSR
ncbi:MAG: amidohydrolase family protein [Candidatus Bathyarchaeia archaeon]